VGSTIFCLPKCKEPSVLETIWAIKKKYFVVGVGVTSVFFNIAFGNTYYVLNNINIGQAVLRNIEDCVLIDLFE
jgi:hypothetical protein